MYLNGTVVLNPETVPQKLRCIVDENQQMFEKNAEALYDAEEMIGDWESREDAWAMIAPEAEAERN